MFFQRLLFIFFFKQKPVFLLQGLARVLFSFLKVSGNIQALESYQSILGMLSDTEGGSCLWNYLTVLQGEILDRW